MDNDGDLVVMGGDHAPPQQPIPLSSSDQIMGRSKSDNYLADGIVDEDLELSPPRSPKFPQSGMSFFQFCLFIFEKFVEKESLYSRIDITMLVSRKKIARRYLF